MTLERENRRDRGQRLKQERRERTDRTSRRFPWLMPTIVALAIILVIAGIIIAAALGKLF